MKKLIFALGIIALIFSCNKETVTNNNETVSVRDSIFQALVDAELNRVEDYIGFINGPSDVSELHLRLINEILAIKDTLPEDHLFNMKDTITYNDLVMINFGKALIGNWTFYNNTTRDSINTATIAFDKKTFGLKAQLASGNILDVIMLSPKSALIGNGFYIIGNERIMNKDVTGIPTPVTLK